MQDFKGNRKPEAVHALSDFHRHLKAMLVRVTNVKKKKKFKQTNMHTHRNRVVLSFLNSSSYNVVNVQYYLLELKNNNL